MSIIREEKGGGALLKIDGSMTINEAAAIRDELVECFKTYSSIILDLEAVIECDAAAMQLLCSARLTAHKSGIRFSVTSASLSSMDSIARAGLDPDAIFSSTGGERI